MKIPKSFKVSNRKYTVQEPMPGVRPNCIKGSVHFIPRTVEVNKIVNGRKMGKRERATVFWHEALHAMLYDMGSHSLNNNEGFVENLAQRITGIIYTARF